MISIAPSWTVLGNYDNLKKMKSQNAITNYDAGHQLAVAKAKLRRYIVSCTAIFQTRKLLSRNLLFFVFRVVISALQWNIQRYFSSQFTHSMYRFFFFLKSRTLQSSNACQLILHLVYDSICACFFVFFYRWKRFTKFIICYLYKLPAVAETV